MCMAALTQNLLIYSSVYVCIYYVCVRVCVHACLPACLPSLAVLVTIFQIWNISNVNQEKKLKGQVMVQQVKGFPPCLMNWVLSLAPTWLKETFKFYFWDLHNRERTDSP